MIRLTIFQFILFSIFTFSTATAQEKMLWGNVFNQDGENLIGATVQWENTSIGTFTDLEGNFELPKNG